jgi:hypothetical protein
MVMFRRHNEWTRQITSVNNVYLADGKTILRTHQTPKMSIQHERQSLTKTNQRKWTYWARYMTNYTVVTVPQTVTQITA